MPTQLTIVHDGEQLMQLLTNETNKLPQVIFLDLNMPLKKCFECLCEMKRDKKLNQIPVIIYSTSFHKRAADLLYAQGADYDISNPSEISNLKKAVQELITLIAQGNFQQPDKEKFLVTVERNNYKTFCVLKTFL